MVFVLILAGNLVHEFPARREKGALR